jgi:hypothetical protein
MRNSRTIRCTVRLASRPARIGQNFVAFHRVWIIRESSVARGVVPIRSRGLVRRALRNRRPAQIRIRSPSPQSRCYPMHTSKSRRSPRFIPARVGCGGSSEGHRADRLWGNPRLTPPRRQCPAGKEGRTGGCQASHTSRPILLRENEHRLHRGPERPIVIVASPA